MATTRGRRKPEPEVELYDGFVGMREIKVMKGKGNTYDILSRPRKSRGGWIRMPLETEANKDAIMAIAEKYTDKEGFPTREFSNPLKRQIEANFTLKNIVNTFEIGELVKLAAEEMARCGRVLEETDSMPLYAVSPEQLGTIYEVLKTLLYNPHECSLEGVPDHYKTEEGEVDKDWVKERLVAVELEIERRKRSLIGHELASFLEKFRHAANEFEGVPPDRHIGILDNRLTLETIQEAEDEGSASWSLKKTKGRKSIRGKRRKTSRSKSRRKAKRKTKRSQSKHTKSKRGKFKGHKSKKLKSAKKRSRSTRSRKSRK